MGDRIQPTSYRDIAPIARFLSQYKHQISMHKEEDPTKFTENALANLSDETGLSHAWFAPEKMLSASLYAEGVNSLLEHFGEDNCLVLFSEDLVRDPETWSSSLTKFLGVSINPPTNNRLKNQSPEIKAEVPESLYVRMLELVQANVQQLPEKVRIAATARWWP